MIRRLATNPAALVLAMLVVLSVVGAVWGVQTTATDRGIMIAGEPNEEQLWRLRLMGIANMLPPIATFVGVAALLGVLAIASVSRRRTAPPRSEEPA